MRDEFISINISYVVVHELLMSSLLLQSCLIEGYLSSVTVVMKRVYWNVCKVVLCGYLFVSMSSCLSCNVLLPKSLLI